MKRSKTSIAFTIIFMLILILPLLRLDPHGGGVSEEENRVLASRPSISDAIHRPIVFIREFDDWFTDNIGFRKRMIELRKNIDRIDRPTQYSDGVNIYLIGQQGHIYFASEGGRLISKFQGNQYLTDEQLIGLADRLNGIGQFLDERDTPFLFVICPDKESVYPEYYPRSIHRGPDPIQLEIITEYLRDNSNVNLYNSRQILMSEKDNFLVYNRAEGDITHYNAIGGFIEYEEMMRHFSAYFPEMTPFTIDDTNIVYDEDDIPSVSLKEGSSSHLLGSEFFAGLDLIDAFNESNYVFENKDPDLPTILIMGDSYTDLFTPFVSQHFGKTIIVHYLNIGRFRELVDLYKPDMVVIQVAERELPLFTDNMINYGG